MLGRHGEWPTEGTTMTTQPTVSRAEWDAARQQLLVKEKEFTRARDAMAAQRRRMPWMAVEKDYAFTGPNGPASLLDLFDGRRQLIVYRAFYAPDITTFAEGGSYPERACVGCSFVADQVAHPAHLNARDTSLVFVSRAPQADIQALKARHGWELIPWYTLTDDFDADFGVQDGTAPTPSSGTAIVCSAPTSSTAAATRPWGAPGAISTSPRSGARRSGRTRRRDTRRHRPTSGGTTTTRTAREHESATTRRPGGCGS
jgi:predicted dithiol-disulfide oxidoreductase (DUF899 family)